MRNPHDSHIGSSWKLHVTSMVSDNFVRLFFLDAHGDASVSAGELPEEADQFRFWWPVRLVIHQVSGICRRSANWSTTQSWDFLAPEWAVQGQRWYPIESSWNFLTPQVTSGFSSMTGIWVPMVMTKKVCQRLADQTSSLRWVLICPIQLIGLKKRIRFGTSSSWDSRTDISVLTTESSTVTTIHCCESRLNCSVWRETTNISLRSRKGS